LPVHDKEPTPVPVPTTLVATEVILPAPALVEVHFHNKGEKSRAKPHGVHGAEFVYALLDEPTEDWTLLTHSVFVTRSPLKLTFAGTERGRKLYISGRWENVRGEKGPWNEIQEIVIP
jgi:hypothetical protein